MYKVLHESPEKGSLSRNQPTEANCCLILQKLVYGFATMQLWSVNSNDSVQFNKIAFCIVETYVKSKLIKTRERAAIKALLYTLIH